jgi:hypothetical protein
MPGGWKFAAASVIGTSHQKSPEGVCQDSHAVKFLDHASAFVGVVSDGAGSASHAQIGSRLTCDFIIREAGAADPVRLFTESFARDTVEKLRAVLFEEADNEGLTIRDFACTMLVAIVSDERASFWQVGDGAICVRETGSDQYRCVYWPEKGDYANVTFFITDVRAQEETQVSIRNAQIEEVAILSDGVERLALDFTAREAHTGFFGGLFPHMRHLAEGNSPELGKQIEGFLVSERVNKRTDDDKTLILASRASQ